MSARVPSERLLGHLSFAIIIGFQAGLLLVLAHGMAPASAGPRPPTCCGVGTMQSNTILLAGAPADSGQPPSPDPPVATPEAAGAVVAFWTEAGQQRWFAADPAFDRRFRERFADDYRAAAAGGLDHWAATPEGSLALLILLDQYPRNSFRGQPAMYATDDRARAVAAAATAAGLMQQVPRPMRTFFVLPFSHSERLPDQEIAVRLARSLGEPDWGQAERHRGIIYRFGRFPHRNAILGRTSTPAEEAYLADGGYRG